MSEFSIVIMGAGAMGGAFGARLSLAGARTTLVDPNNDLVRALNDRGVTLVEPDGERTVPVPARTDVEGLEPPDAVLFFVKCHHTESAALAARPLVLDGTRVVTLQNGWGNAEVLGRVYGTERLVVGVTYTSATTLEPARIKTSVPGRTVLGSPHGDAGLAQPFVSALEEAGFPVEVSADVLTEVWKKLVLNAATLPTAALTRLTAGALASDEDMRWLVDRAAAEAVEVGRALGFDIDESERLHSIHDVLEKAGAGKGSMLQDVEAGRATEIDVIIGAVLREADARGIGVPVTRSLYALVVGLERARGQR